MKLFDWSSPAVAAKYIAKADKRKATERTIRLLSRRTEGEQSDSPKLSHLYNYRQILLKWRERRG